MIGTVRENGSQEVGVDNQGGKRREKRLGERFVTCALEIRLEINSWGGAEMGLSMEEKYRRCHQRTMMHQRALLPTSLTSILNVSDCCHKLVQSLFCRFPVDNVPDSLEVFGFAVLIL